MSLVETLREHERAWEARPFLRELYRAWFEELRARLSPVDGPAVELGSGIGSLRSALPDVVTTDVEPTPWADSVVDAAALPYADASLANLVLVDVFHHLPHPTRFLDEATRVLRPGGRVLMIEPYCSPLSTIAYRRFHHEPADLDADPFADAPQSGHDALDSNQALPTLMFFRRRAELERRWPELRVREARRFAIVAYPLSGGFTRKPFVPATLGRPLIALDRLLTPLAPLAAFRCLVVLERANQLGRTV